MPPAVQTNRGRFRSVTGLLDQRPSSGVLKLPPSVMAVHRTKTAATIRIVVDGETIAATGIHRFWKAEAREIGRWLAISRPGIELRVTGEVSSR